MSAKRKAASGAALGADGPDSKRRKLPDIARETADTTTAAGLAFLAQMKQARDKRNRFIATNFLTLPDKKVIPEYYQETPLPVALDIIEAKLNRHEYPTLTILESDFKRMVSNAKAFNEKNSEIFSDAEKIRKMVSNHMTKINPAYKNPNYTPYPTPIPDIGFHNGSKQEEATEVDADGETDPEAIVEKPRRLVTLHGPSAEKEESRRRGSSTPAVQDAADAGESFVGNTFQQAQEKIVTELIQLKNEDDQLISGPFLNLPSRELRDYYRVIRHPVCLKGVQKQVRGIKGREKPTGVSLFKSWQSYEDEMNYIWNNARLYNEDGSEIFELAAELESYFNRRMQEAKDAVTEPSQPKVKLKLSAKTPEPPPKITLRLGQKSHETANGVTVDSDALKRQQDLVRAGTSGNTISVNGDPSKSIIQKPLGASNITSSTSQAPTQNHSQDRRSGSAGSRPDSSTGVKSEAPNAKSPGLAPTVLRNGSIGSNEATQSPHVTSTNMPPPSSVTPRLPSGSPHPQANHVPHNVHPTNPLDSRWRQPGKDASDALISNLTIATHPAVKLDRHFRLDIPPSPTASQQSVTVTLPATHFYIQVTPTIASNVMNRQSRIFVTVNNFRLNPTVQKLDEADPRRPLYDAKLMPGVNRIEVEMIAGPPRGVPRVGPGQDVELEKCTVFVHLAA